MEEPVKKFFRLAPGKEVRLKGAYIIECQSVVKDDNGNITEIHCTYDPTTKSGTGCQKESKRYLTLGRSLYSGRYGSALIRLFIICRR